MKRVILLFLSLIVITGHAYATDTSKIEVRGTVNDGTAVVEDTNDIVKVFTTGARQQQPITLSVGSNSITVPSGAKAVLLDIGSTKNLHLIGRPGDKGISLDSNCPVLIPLTSDGAVPAFSISNDASSATIQAYWF